MKRIRDIVIFISAKIKLIPPVIVMGSLVTLYHLKTAGRQYFHCLDFVLVLGVIVLGLSWF